MGAGAFFCPQLDHQPQHILVHCCLALGITLVLYVMGFNLVGDALRDVLDPRMRGKT